MLKNCTEERWMEKRLSPDNLEKQIGSSELPTPPPVAERASPLEKPRWQPSPQLQRRCWWGGRPQLQPVQQRGRPRPPRRWLRPRLWRVCWRPTHRRRWRHWQRESWGRRGRRGIGRRSSVWNRWRTFSWGRGRVAGGSPCSHCIDEANGSGWRLRSERWAVKAPSVIVASLSEWEEAGGSHLILIIYYMVKFGGRSGECRQTRVSRV